MAYSADVVDNGGVDTTKRHALGGVLLVLGGLGVYLGVWLGLVVMVAGVMAINWTGNPEP